MSTVDHAQLQQLGLFSDNQIEDLRRSYAALEKMPPDRLPQFRALFALCGCDALLQLGKANINFVSKLAMNEYRRRHAGTEVIQ